MKVLSKAAQKRILRRLRDSHTAYEVGEGRKSVKYEWCSIDKKDLQLLLDLALEINKQHA